MTPDSRLDRIESNLEKLTQVTATIAASVASHDDQIEQLIKVAQSQQQQWAQLQREFQTYLTTIHPRQ
jgi:ABC-type transporter Mla subunit MlaD